jgi:CubicO group peptidase (beta-lactamase class C family)
VRLWLPIAALTLSIGGLSASVAKAEAPLVTVELNDGGVADAVNRALLAAASPNFGGAIIIERDGKLILKAGYGYANREKRIPFRADTIAQIGSISKSFTAAAIADLESRGKVNPKAPVATYLPELKGKPAGAVTIQQLLTHTGGYPEYCGDDFERASIAKILQDCFAPLDAKPGMYAYSNAGFSALAVVVERTSGVSLETYLKDRITGPLGMRDTGYLFAKTTADRHASGYLNGKNEGVISDRIAALGGDYWNLKGNGGIQSSPADMMLWGKALFGERPSLPVMARKLADRRTWAQADQANVYYSCGLNIVVRADGTVQRLSHGGSDGVFYSLFRWYPDERVLVYFVGNSGEDDVKKALLAAIGALKTAVPIRD